MIKCLFKGILSAIAVRLLSDYRHLSVRLLKIEAAKSYLHGVRMARLSVIGLIRAGLVIGLVCLGALLFHVGLFVLLPWTVKAKALLGVCLGLAYVICGGALLRAAVNEKMWMEKSGAVQLLEEVTGVKNQTKE
jgi:hypothetical protein